jgi:cytochrome c oxidase subunit 2
MTGRRAAPKLVRGGPAPYAPVASLGAVLAGAAPVPALARTPLSYLTGHGAKAYPVVALTWGLAIISVLVTLIVTGLVVWGVYARRVRGAGPIDTVPVARGSGGLRWIGIGVGISSVALLGSLVWTVIVLAAVNGPGGAPPLTIEVTGLQWWWKARYIDDDPLRAITVANEIHIPVGQPIRVKLIGGDVIHSFWVPALTGKTDTIPGQTNITWLEASRPGRFRGQCTEYCGEQHAHMAFEVVAETPDQFEAWRQAQAQPGAAATAPQAQRGEHLFEFHCGACHAVRGTRAGGSVAPDLTHLMSRRTIAAGTLPNTPGNLVGWIANPQQIKPGTLMPNLYLSGPDLTDISTYLQSLK